MNIIKSNCFPLYYIFFFKLLQRCCQQRSDRQNYSRISFNNCSIINKKPDETGVSSLKLLIVKNSLYQFVSRNCRNYWSLAGNIWKLKSFRESPFTLFLLARYFWEQSRVDFSPRSTLAEKEVRYVEASKVRSHRAGRKGKEISFVEKSIEFGKRAYRGMEGNFNEQRVLLFRSLVTAITISLISIIEDIHRCTHKFSKGIEFFIARICATTVS